MKFGLRYLALIVTTFAALGLNASALLRQPMAPNQATQRAALVVRFDSGQIAVEQCVSFSEPEITGYDLLRKSQWPVIASQFNGMGAAICKIADQGCPAEDCFCKSVSEQKSWFFWTLQNGAWVSSNAGASGAKVTEGVVHGWVWGSGSPIEPARTFEQICNAAPAAPTSTSSVSTSTSTTTSTSTNPPPQPIATATATSAPIASDLMGGGQVISGTINPPVPTVIAVANAPAPSPVVGVTVVVVVAVAVPTSTPAAIAPTAAVPTDVATLTPTPTFTPEPTLSATATITSTPTFTTEPTLAPTPTLTPEPTLSSTSTSTISVAATHSSTPTITPTPTPPETPPAPSLLGYALFGVIALGLVGGIALTRMRR